jgi:hypothetical protein
MAYGPRISAACSWLILTAQSIGFRAIRQDRDPQPIGHAPCREDLIAGPWGSVLSPLHTLRLWRGSASPPTW